MKKYLTRAAAALAVIGAVFSMTAARSGIPVPQYPAGGIHQPAAGVANHGKVICPTKSNPDPWVRIESTPRLRAISAGTCISVPTNGRAGMTIQGFPKGDGYFPNISSGYQLGYYGCPESGNSKLCPQYPVKFTHDGYPVLSFKEWSEPNYLGNFATDNWLAPNISYTSYASRCAPLLGQADVEVMVWFTHPGDIAVPDVGRMYSTRIDGRRWRVETWETANHCPAGEGWRLLIFMAPRQVNGPLTVHGVKLNKFYSWAMHNGMLGKDYYLISQNLGWETHAGGVGNRIDSMTLAGTK